jgi:hypothetical protein
VRDRASTVLYRDTDSSIVPATRHGGQPVLVGDELFRYLSFAEVDAIVHAFEALRPSPGWPVWKITKGESP